MDETHHLTRSAHERLKAEHAQLTTHGRIEIARKIEAARELGDLTENGDYHAAKEEQGKMETRIAQLTYILENVEIVEGGTADGRVKAGSVVAILYEGDEEEERYLVGSIEERHDDLEVVSPTSPLGAALIGANVGETVSFESPAGMLAVTVVDVEA
ncbi:MAG: transcription elongation factor GreA [Actinobacteria bacterium]|nr:MAG: transcription elongation factor GreA [Actinomycetota bacterium]RIK04007.1 MAG: transcription elongation factor GreA [Acidobacteriota bacterium]